MTPSDRIAAASAHLASAARLIASDPALAALDLTLAIQAAATALGLIARGVVS